MANLDIYTYDPALQAAQIARQQKMAELLQQQGEQPIDIQSYQGTQAPISWGSVLAKALKSGLGTYLGGKADQDAAALQSKSLADAKAYYDPTYDVNIPGASYDVTLEDMPTAGNAMAGAPKPSINPEDLQGPMNAPSVNPEDLQVGPTPDQNPRGLKIPDIFSAPQKYTFGIAPSTGTATYSPEEQMARARAAQFSSNPVIRSAAAGEMARLKPEYKEIGAGGLARIDDNGNVSMVAGPKQTKSFETLTPEQIAKAGLPKGTIAVTSADGNLEIKYNPTANAISESMLAIAQQNLGLNQQRFNADQTAKASGVYDQETLDQMAAQGWTGDKSVFTGINRGPNGAINTVGLRKALYRYGNEHGKTPAELANMNNQYQGALSEQRTLGTTAAKIGSANAGLDIVLDQANEAYDKLGRGNFVPFNKLQQMATTNAFSTPEQADAYAADVGAVNMWAKAINPSGVLTVENARRGTEMLNNASSPEAHKAVLERMRREGAAAKKGVDTQRNIGGATAPAQGGAAAPGGAGSAKPDPLGLR
jgi:hypothetical protein